MAWWIACLGFIWTPISDALVSCINSNAEGCLTWLRNLAGGEITSVIQLDSMTEDLDQEMRYLKGAREDLVADIGRGVVRDQIPTSETEIWLENVYKLEADEGRFHEDKVSQQNTGFSLISYLELGRRVSELLNEAERLKTQKTNLTVLLREAPPNPVDLQSVPIHSIGGIDDTLSKIHFWLEDDGSQIVGIYGMGGVGKTTLLKTINNEFFRTKSGGFDLVMFVEVSRDPSIQNIQDEIGRYLGYSSSFDQDICSKLPQELKRKSLVLRKALLEKKFLLLLDDLWAKVDLEKVGVPVYPYSKRGSKIIFTTRSEEVCNDMGAARLKIKVPYLSEESSWKLFCECAGKEEDQWTDSTRPLAKTVASRCGGLPLALITVGRAMASATTPGEWEEAVRMLGGMPVELRNMEEDVLNILKFSFDSLRDERQKECLLYCSLFPYGWTIKIPTIIEYWIGEGFLDDRSHPFSYDAAYNRGLRIITALKAASLLEEGYHKEERVKLHDTVRQMLCWITSRDYGAEKHIFLLGFGEAQHCAPTKERWMEATRILLTNNSISELPLKPDCHNLRTLILHHNPSLSHIHGGFFQFMPFLNALDLSHTGITHLPPQIGLLVSLRFLNLSFTPLESLPMEIGRLKMLKKLDLLHVDGLKSIPREAISSLSCLQSLNVYNGSYTWLVERNDDDEDCEETEVCLKDLDGLTQLDRLGFNVGAISSTLCDLMRNSDRLCASTRDLRVESLDSCSSWYFTEFLEVVEGLRVLFVCNCPELDHLIIPTHRLTQLEMLALEDLPKTTISWVDGNAFSRASPEVGVFKKLKTLVINRCEMLEANDITWIKGLPSLQGLMIIGPSKTVEKIVTDVGHERDPFLPKLRHLLLFEMQNLDFICREPLLLPSLETIRVVGCDRLKRLPFRFDSAENISQIIGSQEWWNKLEWDHDDIRSRFTSYFVELVYMNHLIEDFA